MFKFKIRMTKDQLIKANLELQSRINNQNKSISELKNRVSELVILNKNLTLDKDNLIKKINHKEQILTQYQNKKPIKEKVNLYKNKKVLSKIDRKNKSNYNKRKKAIYGILKNTSRYSLSQIEIKFLESIRNKKDITPKQKNWYEAILNRGKTKK